MTLAVIGASANIARVAQSLSDELLFIQRPGAMNPQILRDDVDELYTVDYRDLSLLRPLAQHILSLRRPCAVVSVTEDGLEPAAILSEMLGTPGTPPEVVRLMRDKSAMRETLRKRAPHLSVPFARGDDGSAVEELFATCDRVIAKPVDGTASLDVRLLCSVAQIRDIPDPGKYILEGYIPGQEFSVESFSNAGVHDIVVIAEKGTADNFVEVSHLVPPATIGPVQIELISAAVRELLDALQLRDGPAHTEVKLHGDTVKVIETHNRPGGDGIADLVTITTGIDWRRVCLGWPIGERPVPGIPEAPAAANLFFTARPGRVARVIDRPFRFADVKLVYWEVDVEPGDLVGELHSSRDRLGVATIAGPSAKACLRVLESFGHDSVVITEDAAQ